MPFTAVTENGVTIYPEPGLRGFCKGCAQPMIAKCGELVTWHFAHDRNKDCQYGGETKDHLRWKKIFHDHGAEIEYQLRNGRADIYCKKSNAVVEVCITNPSNKEGIRYKQAQYQVQDFISVLTGISYERV